MNATTFKPGDRLLFEAGQTFGGTLVLQGAGTAAQPIVVSSYGSGPATIASGTAAGFYSYNAAGIELRRLAFVGAGRLSSTNSGVVFYLDAPGTNLSYLRLDSLDVSGYRSSGISIGSWQGSSGYSDVRITASQVHANGEAGLSSYSEGLAAHHQWYVGTVQAYDNAGRADVTTTNTGSGILLSGIDGALVENCLAYHNGWLNANPDGGPVGIWGYCCNNLVIQKSESHHNSSGTAHDGGGFDLDGGCTNSVLQYNYSHDNGGPGYLLAQYYGAPAMHDVTIRYNVSKDDARRDSQGALLVWSSGDNGGIQRATIHNNTVLLTPTTDGSSPTAVLITSGGFSDLAIRNNVLQTTGGLPVLGTVSTTGLRLQGNCYWNPSQLVIDWNGTRYTDLASWRTATGQEQLGTGRLTGLNADPKLPGADPTRAPMAISPVRGAGLNLQAEFNVNPGPQDFVGNPTPAMPTAGNIGALESVTTTAAPLPVVLTAFTAQRVGPAAQLGWHTASEAGNAFFVVEYSLDGITFTSLGQVPGQGTSTQPHTYSYTDANLAQYPAGPVYYRLRQVDTDGQATYSPVRTLAGLGAGPAAQARLHVYPNPAAPTARIVVQASAGTQVQLLDIRGQLLASVPVAGDGSASLLPTSGLAAGLYIVRCGTQSTRLLLTQ
ncbi:right-handed parallel beta-helix repeat-containing protein [Hymenobacter cheonanensis]|uniref:right-handed parallel beta-helix repeat-containing protein n=1 Tax=Hymenobacter sp. CA2-7 TaxID=3063993 RepID=UPI002713D8FB|nr:right-handed parallel beta-helix repeat-containing protein [Hymenobacter sp. CA2-7]MDO7887076.1 right-handed parallel beta-helix repeat-containing protein [Hymenobacter sp. CA2-7]